MKNFMFIIALITFTTMFLGVTYQGHLYGAYFWKACAFLIGG